MHSLFIDADACPVKEECFRVAERVGFKAFVVSNGWINLRRAPFIEQVVVDAGPDVADDWIAERADAAALVITSDILLAGRCLENGARVLAPTGKPFTDANIGGAIATRAIMADLRAGLEQTGGPAPFSGADRSRFLNALDREIVQLKRAFPKN